MDQRGSRAFRSGLREALPAWRAEGLLDEAAAARLAERHGLSDPALDGPGLLPIYVLAALLAAAGVASLVAWHWDELGRAVRVAIVFALVIGAHLGGDRLRRAGRFPRLGEGLALLGSLLFGAGIGLMAQIFQVSGEWYGIFGGFAVGALAAGLLLDSGATLMAAAVAAVGLWASGWTADHRGGLGLLAPYAAAAPFLLAGWRRRSPALLAVTALGLGVAALCSADDGVLWVFPPLLLGAGLLAVPLSADPPDAPLAAALAAAGRIGFALTAFVIAFHDTARWLTRGEGPHFRWTPHGVEASSLALSVATGALVLGLVRRRGGARSLAEPLLASAGVAGVAFGLSRGSPVLIAVAANAALVALAGVRVAVGLTALRRWPFWEGVALAALLLVARFLEIERLLWLKGLGFLGCAAAVTFAATTFERRRTEVRHAA
jgi:Predicted membrane protein (DUF2157)